MSLLYKIVTCGGVTDADVQRVIAGEKPLSAKAEGRSFWILFWWVFSGCPHGTPRA